MGHDRRTRYRSQTTRSRSGGGSSARIEARRRRLRHAPAQAARRLIVNRPPLTSGERPSRRTSLGDRRWENGEAAKPGRYLGSDIRSRREVEAQRAAHPGPLLKFQG